MRWLGAVLCASLTLGVAGAGGAAPQPGELVFPSSRAPEFHNEIYVLDTKTGARRNLSRNPTADHHPTPSPDGRLIAFVSDRGGRGEAVWRMSSEGRNLRRLHEPLDGYIDSLQWSSDGTWLALHLTRFNQSSAAYVVPANGGSARPIGPGSFNVAWLPGGRLAVGGSSGVTVRDLSGTKLWQRPGSVAAVSTRGELALANAGRLEIVSSRGVRRRTLPGFTQGQWSPDGTLLAYAARSGIRLLDLRNRVRLLGPRLTLAGGWAPDGRSLLAAEKDTFRAVSVALDGRVSPVRVTSGTWSRNGTLLLGYGTNGRLAVWRPGSQPRALTAPPRNEPCPVYYRFMEWLDDRRVVVEFGRGGQQDSDLWATDRSGSPLRRLRGGNDWAAAPEWAPDGSRIAYESGDVLTHGGGCGSVSPHIRVMSADGSGDRALTPADGYNEDEQPRWSPDGSKVAFHRANIGGSVELSGVFIVDVASRSVRQLTQGLRESVSWAPDGKRLAFSGDGGLWIADLEHDTVTRIGSGERPEWSPQGVQIAYVRGGELWTTTADGTNARRLAPVKPVGDLRWSRDGSLLTFGVREGVLLVGRNGTIRRRILQAGGRNPRLSRDGRMLAFVVTVGDWSREAFNGSLRTELYVAATSGGAARRITRDFANVGDPGWR